MTIQPERDSVRLNRRSFELNAKPRMRRRPKRRLAPPHSIIGRRAIITDPGYLRGQHNVFGQIGYLLLDEALGEFDVETKVSYIGALVEKVH